LLAVGCVTRGEIIKKEGSFWTAGNTASSHRRFKIQMKTYNDPTVDYSKLKKFRLEFRATESYNPLLNKHLNSLVKESLIENDLIEDADNPDIIVMGTHQNIFVPDRDPGIQSQSGSFSGYAGGQSFHGTYHSGDGLVTAIIKAKRAQRYWIHDFGVVFLDPKKNAVIWIGNATAWVRVDDIRETASDVIKFLIGLYPKSSFAKLSTSATTPKTQLKNDTREQAVRVYKNEGYHFTLEYPTHYKLQRLEGKNEVFRAANPNASLVPVILVTIRDAGADAPLDAQALIKTVKESNPGSGHFQVLSEKKVTLNDGTPGLTITYKWLWTDGWTYLQSAAMLVLKDGKSISARATTILDDGTTLGMLLEMVSTLKFY